MSTYNFFLISFIHKLTIASDTRDKTKKNLRFVMKYNFKKVKINKRSVFVFDQNEVCKENPLMHYL